MFLRRQRVLGRGLLWHAIQKLWKLGHDKIRLLIAYTIVISSPAKAALVSRE